MKTMLKMAATMTAEQIEGLSTCRLEEIMIEFGWDEHKAAMLQAACWMLRQEAAA